MSLRLSTRHAVRSATAFPLAQVWGSTAQRPASSARFPKGVSRRFPGISAANNTKRPLANLWLRDALGNRSPPPPPAAGRVPAPPTNSSPRRPPSTIKRAATGRFEGVAGGRRAPGDSIRRYRGGGKGRHPGFRTRHYPGGVRVGRVSRLYVDHRGRSLALDRQEFRAQSDGHLAPLRLAINRFSRHPPAHQRRRPGWPPPGRALVSWRDGVLRADGGGSAKPAPFHYLGNPGLGLRGRRLLGSDRGPRRRVAHQGAGQGAGLRGFRQPQRLCALCPADAAFRAQPLLVAAPDGAFGARRCFAVAMDCGRDAPASAAQAQKSAPTAIRRTGFAILSGRATGGASQR